jgi:hypothetical protein
MVYLLVLTGLFFVSRWISRHWIARMSSGLWNFPVSPADDFMRLLQHISASGLSIVGFEQREYGFLDTAKKTMAIQIPQGEASAHVYAEAFLLWGQWDTWLRFDRANWRFSITVLGSTMRTVGFSGTLISEWTRFLPDEFAVYFLMLYGLGVLLGAVQFIFYGSALQFATREMVLHLPKSPEIHRLIGQFYVVSWLSHLIEALNPAVLLVFWLDELLQRR